MTKPQTQRTRRNAIYESSSDAPTTLFQGSTSRTSIHFFKDSFRKLQTSSPSNASQVAELQKALEDAKLLNSKHQEEIQVLTLERDAAEDALHDNKRHYRALMEDLIDSDKELEQTGLLLKKAIHETEVQKTTLHSKDQEISQLRQSKDAEILDLHQAATKSSQSLSHLKAEKSDLEAWVAEIKACVQDVHTHHRTLETKTQSQDHLINSLRSEISLLKRDLKASATNHEMNKKALLRTTTDLRAENEKLKVVIVDEQDKTREARGGVDWRAQCMQTHRRKTVEIERLEAEVKGLRGRNGELERGLEALREEIVREDSSVGVECSGKNLLGKAIMGNGVAEVVAVADLPPSEGFGGKTETGELSVSTVMGSGKRESGGGVAGPVVFLGCLSAALYLRR